MRRTANKPLILLLGAALAGAAAARAQNAEAVSVDVTPSYVSQYMFRGERLGGQSIQAPVEAGCGPWTLGVWADAPIRDASHQSDPEVDYYGACTIRLAGNLDLRPGATLYTYPRNGLGGGFAGSHAGVGEGFFRSTFEPCVALDYTIGGLKLTAKYACDTVLKGSDFEVGAGYAVPLGNIGTEIDFSASAGYSVRNDASRLHDSAAEVKASTDYWSLGASLPYQIARGTTVRIGWEYDRGNGHVKQGILPEVGNPEAVGRGVLAASIAYRF